MLKLKVIMSEDFNEATSEVVFETVDIELEHSLATLSKWETIWEIPLLSKEEKTQEQNFSYVECMCLTPNIAPEVFRKLTQEQHDQISAYLEKKHTATWFNTRPESRSGETITSELIYYWMDSLQINWEAQYWHLNRLLTLIKVHSLKGNNKPKRQSTRERNEEIFAINAKRRAELESNG